MLEVGLPRLSLEAVFFLSALLFATAFPTTAPATPPETPPALTALAMRRSIRLALCAINRYGLRKILRPML